VRGILEWLARHRSAVAAAAALFVVWRVVRAVIGGVWFFAGWDDIAGAGDWTLDHWPLAVAALAALFALVFVVVRAVIPWLERRERSRPT
jgi:hypothetical protein